MKLRLFAVVCFFLASLLYVTKSGAQDFSNKGRDFWLAYPGHIDGNNSRMALYISSNVNTSGVVNLPGGTIPFTVTANQATVVQISPNNYNVLNPQAEGTFNGRGIHITSQQPVVVYAHLLNAARSGSTLVLPTNTLGREYIAASFRSMTNSQPPNGAVNGAPAGSQFTIVAPENNTVVEITPSVPDFTGMRAANVPFTITLNRGDVYQYRSSFSNDITGTRIRTISTGGSSCKPVAVFCGSSWTSMDCANASGGDNLFLQLMPQSAWGRNYVTAPFADRQYDIFRIIVGDPTTVVTRNGTALSPLSLINGTYYQFTSTGPNVITSDKPIMVIQYMISQTCDTRNANTTTNAPFPGDPEMIIINPIEQTLNDVTVVSARANLTPPNTNITKHFFTIIMKTAATSSLRINGTPPSGSFVAIGTSGYSYLHENVTGSTNVNPSHRITADSGFIALAYGLGQFESYGYNAGTNIIDLYQYISLKNEFATVNFPATCVGTPFRFSITLPYQPVRINWDFSAATGLSPAASVDILPPAGQSVIPPDSSFVVDGKTLFMYRLPANYSFANVGTFPVKVLVNNPTPDGCSGDQEINYSIQVYPKPLADFSIAGNGCVNDPVQFDDLTNGNGRAVTRWIWDFGDGTDALIKNPQKTYMAAGNYNVKLTAITDIGCVAEKTTPFAVATPPVASFTVGAPTCAATNIVFTDASTIAQGVIDKWNWNFGNGNTQVNTSNGPVTQTFANAGSYNVSLQVETASGCKSNVFSLPIQVAPLPDVDFTIPAAVCLPVGEAAFVNQSAVNGGGQLNYEWSFGDGGSSVVRDPVHHYSATGPFNVNLKVTTAAGCLRELTKPINTIFARPTATFSTTQEICLREGSSFTSNSIAPGQVISSWHWNLGDGTLRNTATVQHTYLNAGTYNASLYVVSDKGCFSDTFSLPVMVRPLPTANFELVGPACANRDAVMNSTSVANAGTLNQWNWNFGDGTSVSSNTNAAQIKTYNTPGTYQVQLQVSSSTGCISDPVSKPVVVGHLPVANFIAPEVCLNDSYAQFLDSSYITDGTDSSFTYLWNFGDPNANATNPNTSTLKHPTHKYTALGNYTATLIVTSTNGCTDTIAKTFTVNGSFPVANFQVLNAASLCSNRDVVIQNKSVVTPGNITRLEIYWDYLNNPTQKVVDDVPFFDKTYSHRYPDFQQPLTRQYQIRVVAFSGATCLDDQVVTVTVNASPKVQFLTVPGICLEAAPRQITQAVETGGLPKAFDWYAGNSAVNGSGLFQPAVAGAGTHPLSYLFVTPAGCRDSATGAITVWPLPVANFNIGNPACEKAPLTFTDASAANFSSITTWNWNFGDGNSLPRNSNAPFTHMYNTAATYTVSLSVQTDSGCVSAVTTRNLQVNHLPRVNFEMPSICLPDGRGTFTDLSTIPDGTESQFSYLWDFGDPFNNSASTLKNGTHRYSAEGPYQVKLRVTSNQGCRDSLTRLLTTIYPQPKADFAFTPGEVCLGESFSFTDQSDGRGAPVNAWRWNFADGSAIAQTSSATRTYSNAGSYAVALHVFNTRGCVSDTVVKTVTVHPFPVVNAGPDLFVLEDGFITFTPTVTGSQLQYRWTPGQFLDDPNVARPRFTPGTDQVYRLTVTGIGGCTAFDEVFVKVLKGLVVPNAFSPNGDGINDTWNIRYLESYPGASVEVFDRYGKPVFISRSYDRPWDGTIKGKPLPAGVYYYIINPRNGRKPISGSLTIIR